MTKFSMVVAQLPNPLKSMLTLSPFTVPFTPMALNSPETTVGVVSEPLPLQAIRNNDIASVTAPKQMRLICWQVHKVWLIFIISISLIFEIKRGI
jgi:hypothetical protein